MKKHICIIIIIILTGCKKYPDNLNNAITLRTVKERLCRTWCEGVNNYPSQADCNVGLTFYTNGSMNYMFFSTYPYTNSGGNWKLINHDKTLRIINPNNNSLNDFTIYRLEKKDGYFYMKLKNDTATFYFIGQYFH